MKDLSLHILDLVHNSVTAKASRIEISISEDKTENSFKLLVSDNGKGIDPEILPKVVDPYTTNRKTRKVGMGLPLLKHNAEQAGGGVQISSEVGKGTEVMATFEYDHIDRPPIGDIAGVLLQLLSGFQDVHIKYLHRTANGEFILDSQEIGEVLGDVSVNDPEIRKYLNEMILENLIEIKADM